MRILVLAALACLLCRWVLGRWPWDYLRAGTAGNASLQQARALLGVGAGATRAEVIAAHRQLVARVHPDRGGSDAAMQEANAARDLLLARMPAPRQRADDETP